MKELDIEKSFAKRIEELNLSKKHLANLSDIENQRFLKLCRGNVKMYVHEYFNIKRVFDEKGIKWEVIDNE